MNPFYHPSDGEYEKRGYLSGEFRLFRLSAPVEKPIGYHYHDFDKLIVLLGGASGYSIEGSSYELKPFDMVLVPHYSIHRPEIRPGAAYDRMILYLSPSFLSSQKEDADLSLLFSRAAAEHSYVLRLPSLEKSSLFASLLRLEEACREEGFADVFLRRLLLFEFLVYLNRAALSGSASFPPASCQNAAVLSMMRYIRENLSGDLSVDSLSARFFLSRAHMMRLFKRETGCTIGNYITEKRLLLARELLTAGGSVTDVCYRCGFKNYAAFLRAYKKSFGETPCRQRRI